MYELVICCADQLLGQLGKAAGSGMSPFIHL